MKKYLFLLMCVLFMVSLDAKAQTTPISGVVNDVDGAPILGASIMEIGTTNGITTDIDGKFTLNVNPKGKLRISCVGFVTQEINVSGKKTFIIKLKEDTEMLDEVVVTAYGGKQLRSKVTNSIAKVGENTLKQGLFSNPAQALSGAVAGLRVSQTSGNPGSTPSVILRGGTDFNGGGSPLILVDGQVRGSLSDINPNDIESMEVLKDAGATAIYGARANNGVILITTKRGRSGTAEVNLSAKVGVNYFNNTYDFMGARDYLWWLRTGYKNADTSTWGTHPDGTAIKKWADLGSLKTATPYGTGNRYFAADGVTPLDGNVASNAIWSTMIYSDQLSFLLNQGWQTMVDPVYGDKLIFKETKMEDFNVVSPALSQEYNINVRGGNDKGNYYAGIGYNKSEGNAYGNFYERLSFILNADYKIKPWLKSESSFSFTDAKWNGLPPTQTDESNYFSRVFSVPPTFRGYNAKGEMLLGANSGDGNQQFNFEKFIRDNNTDKFTMSQAFTVDIIKGLYLKASALWHFSEGKYESFNKDFLSRPGTLNTTRATSASYDRTLDQTYNVILNFNKQIGRNHSLDAMLGFEYYDSYYKGFSASGEGAPTDDFMDLGLTTGEKDKRRIDSGHVRHRIMSFFGRANYDYMSKYLLSFVMRRDGYSRLARENRWGVFPGVSAGWVFSKEDFMKGTENIISFGKLRTSFGLNGNVNPNFVGAYTVQGSYVTNKYNGKVGYLIGNLPNPFLVWEKSRTFEVGLDMGFLANRINANLTFYDRLTTDKYANIDIPSVSGITQFVSNNGEFRNRGLEFELGFRVIDNKDLRWTINWNGAYNKNIVVKLPYNKKIRNQQGAFEVYSGKNKDERIWVGGYQEGQTPGDLYVYQAEGIYRTQEEIPAGLIDVSHSSPLYGGKEGYDKLGETQKKNSYPIKPGDVKWKDVNGDGKIDQFDKVRVGNTVPKWTGGLNTTVSWKSLVLSVRMDYALGFKAIDTRTPWLMGAMQGTYNTIEETKDTWSANNVNAKYPIYVFADQNGKNNYRTSSLFVYNGDYLSFREISLSYTLPKSWANKVRMERVNLSVTGQNLGYWTEAKHLFSPERAHNHGGYPLPRTLIFGANVTF